MSEEYTRKVLKQSVAKMCLTIGWHSSMTTPIEVLTDILGKYLLELGRTTNEYATGFGMTEPNLDHLAMAFRDFHINLPELEDYVQNVDIIEPVAAVPKYPLPKEDHLNFLKPGSKEVVTRPVHVHEHMPPMFPLLEGTEDEPELEPKKVFMEDIVDVETLGSGVKKPVDISPNDPFKRPRLLTEEEGRPTREISSVMMTTSGFLSPAREGKLPESRSPIVAIDPPPAPRPASPADHPPKIARPPAAPERRPLEPTKLFPPHGGSPMGPSKKKSFVKNLVKSKLKPAAHNPGATLNRDPGGGANDVKSVSSQPHVLNEVNKALAAARLKTEKLNTTITPVVPQIEQPVVIPSSLKLEAQVDKLFTEPDKKKVNIFKKISNVKNDKTESSKVLKEQKPDHSAPAVVIEERGAAELPHKVHHLSSDITIELINAPAAGKGSERMHFDDDSPPGTPSAPRTPEMIAQSPPRTKEKRKRKDKSKVRKMAKVPSSARLEHDLMEANLDRPKTPEARFMSKDIQDVVSPVVPPIRFPFFSNFAGPGLIPTPLFPHLPLAPLGSFGQPPYLPPVHPGIPHFVSHPKPPEPPSAAAPPEPPTQKPPPQPTIPPTLAAHPEPEVGSAKPDKKSKEHKKERKEKEKIKKKNKKDKTEKKKLKEEKKEKVKKEKKEKRKEKDEIQIEIPKLTLKLHPSSPNPEIVEPRKLNIKPIVKKEEEPLPPPPPPEPKREASPELAKISALVTGMPKPKISCSNPVVNQTPKEEPQQAKEEVAAGCEVSPPPRPGAGPGRPRSRPPKPKSTKPNKHQNQVKDSDGNKVWICPACGKQDDGSPMIGCDDCDAWYHWVCVGIQVPPEDDEDWYCRLCISKKQEVLQGDRKKKRKRKEKKEH